MAVRVRLIAALALVAATLATGVAGAARAAKKHQSKSSYTVVSINPQPVAPGVLDWSLGMHAYFDAVNASGGLDGHKIKYVSCLDGSLVTYSQQLSATCAQTAVSDHAIAVIGSITDYDDVVYPTLEAHSIPDIGTFPTSPIDYTSKASFPFLTPGIVLFAGAAEELVYAGKCKKIGMIDEAGTSQTAATDAAFAAGGKAAGAKVVTALDVPGTQADYASEVDQLANEGVCGIGFGLQTGLPALINDIASSSNPKMKVAEVAADFPQSTLSSIGAAANGIYAVQASVADGVVSNYGPKPASGAEKLMLARFKKYEPAALAGAEIDWPGYQAAAAFGQAFKKMVKDKLAISGKDLLKVLDTSTIDTGIFPAVNFSRPGPVKSLPRVHSLSDNWLIVRNDTYKAVGHGSHDFASALKNFKITG